MWLMSTMSNFSDDDFSVSLQPTVAYNRSVSLLFVLPRRTPQRSGVYIDIDIDIDKLQFASAEKKMGLCWSW